MAFTNSLFSLNLNKFSRLSTGKKISLNPVDTTCTGSPVINGCIIIEGTIAGAGTPVIYYNDTIARNAKVSSNQGKIVQDVISELDTRGEKPKFVYFTEKDCSKIINFVDVNTKVILSLAFDTGARVTELMNIKVNIGRLVIWLKCWVIPATINS